MFLHICLFLCVLVDGIFAERNKYRSSYRIITEQRRPLFCNNTAAFAVFLRECKLVIFFLYSFFLVADAPAPFAKPPVWPLVRHHLVCRLFFLAFLFFPCFQHGKEFLFISCFAQNHHSEDTNQSGNEVIIIQTGRITVEDENKHDWHDIHH